MAGGWILACAGMTDDSGKLPPPALTACRAGLPPLGKRGMTVNNHFIRWRNNATISSLWKIKNSSSLTPAP